MPPVKLPTKLGVEPILDAVFELRFGSSVNAAGLLPGFLFSKLPGVEDVRTMPAAQLPEQIRSADPGLRYVALSRLNWQRYFVLVGQHSLGLGCRLPYPGWRAFGAAIQEVLGHVVGTPFIGTIERCSLKYVNVFDLKSHAEALETFNIGVRVGAHNVRAENLNLRVEIPRDGLLHGISVVTSATVVMEGASTPRIGAVLDVDTIALDQNISLREFVDRAPSLLEHMHQSNHEVFFECLTEAGLAKLEPKYE